MDRKDLIRSKEYWLSDIQIKLYNLVKNYIEKNKLTEKEAAKRLDLYDSQLESLLKGEYNGSLSSIINILLKTGFVPIFEPLSFNEYELADFAKKLNRDCTKSINSENIDITDEDLFNIM